MVTQLAPFVSKVIHSRLSQVSIDYLFMLAVARRLSAMSSMPSPTRRSSCISFSSAELLVDLLSLCAFHRPVLFNADQQPKSL